MNIFFKQQQRELKLEPSLLRSVAVVPASSTINPEKTNHVEFVCESYGACFYDLGDSTLQELTDWLLSWKKKVAELRKLPIGDYLKGLEDLQILEQDSDEELWWEWRNLYYFHHTLYRCGETILTKVPRENYYTAAVASPWLLLPFAEFIEITEEQLQPTEWALYLEGDIWGRTELFGVAKEPGQEELRYFSKGALEKQEAVIFTDPDIATVEKAWRAAQIIEAHTDARWRAKLFKMMIENQSE